MELIYLWVEKYKNIKNEGFSFSPRFNCKFYSEYDAKGKLKNNCELVVIENKKYFNLFPNDINITAIVGENGSGKSNLLEVLSEYNLNNTVIKVYYNNGKLLYKINNKIKINTNCIKSNINDKTVFYTEISSTNALNNKNITNISLWNNVQSYDYNILESLNLINNKMQTNHMILMKKYNFLPGINKKPLFIEFSFNHHYFDDIRHDNIDDIWINILKILIDRDKDKYKDGNEFEEYLLYGYEDLQIKNVKRFIKNKINDDETILWLKELIDLTDSFIDNYQKIINSKVKYIEQIIPKNVRDEFEFIDNKIKTFTLSIKFEDFSENFLLSIENLFSYSRDELIISLKWDISLSTGEESFLNLFSSIYNCIKQYSYHFEHINIIIDEIEAYLHPNWQIKFIDIIIDFFSLEGIKQDSKTNIILTSHSPFILSDLTKQNIIFLKDGKQVQPFREEEQTFGANIHNLLSHAFFMDDGLMGQFAKKQINKIKNFYDESKDLKNDDKIFEKREKEYKRNKKEFDYIQSIIGEPFIQTIIKNYLDELDIIFYGKKYFLTREINRLLELQKTLK